MKNILILDTETAGDFGSPLIYDLGYKIITPMGETLVERNTIIAEVFDTKSMMGNAYYASKFEEYVKWLENGEIEKMTFKKAILRLIADIKKNKVEYVCAYNLAFDVRALNQSMRVMYNEGFEKQILDKLFNQKNKKLLCIWNLACETVLDTDDYRKFATENGLITDKGNYQTGAEMAYKYIKQNANFIENHTALSDAQIETEILLYIFENYKGVPTFGLHYGSWQKVQKKGK